MTVIAYRPEGWPLEWWSVKLLERELDLAYRVARIWESRRPHVSPSRHDMPDTFLQNLWGAQAKIAFRVLTGLPLGSDVELADQWRDPLFGYLVKGTRRAACDLLVDAREQDNRLYPFARYALLALDVPWVAIVGEIEKREAWAKRRPIEGLHTPSFGVGMLDLAPYSGPRATLDPARGDVTCEHGTYPDGQRCYNCRPLQRKLFPRRDGKPEEPEPPPFVFDGKPD